MHVLNLIATMTVYYLSLHSARLQSEFRSTVHLDPQVLKQSTDCEISSDLIGT